MTAPQEVIGLKHRLSEDPVLAKLVCSLAVLDIAGDSGSGSEGTQQRDYLRAQAVAGMSIRCYEDLQEALAMRNDEWPQSSLVGPGELNLALERVLAGGQNA
jgi:hypothetical protein